MHFIRTLIVDDHAFFARILKTYLEEAGSVQVAGMGRSGEEAEVLAKKLKVDLVIMKIHLPGLSGMEVSRRIKEYRSDIRVILYTDSAPVIYMARPDYCADACVLQDGFFNELPRLIENLDDSQCDGGKIRPRFDDSENPSARF